MFISNPSQGASVSWHNALVLDAAPTAGAWTDLDLSATVGAKTTLCILGIAYDTNDIGNFCIRANGDTKEYFVAANEMATHGSDTTTTAGGFRVILCFTDSAGIIEYYADIAGNKAQLYLLGYIN